ICFETKQEIALKQLRWACEQGLPRGVALMDPGYGQSGEMRAGVTAVGLTYVAGIQSNTLAWPPGTGPTRISKTIKCKTRPSNEPDLVTVNEIALNLAKNVLRKLQ